MRTDNHLPQCSLKDSNLQPSLSYRGQAGRDGTEPRQSEDGRLAPDRRRPPETAPADRNGSATQAPTCKRCPETDPERFGRRTHRGRPTWQPYCKACQVEYHRQWRAKAEGRAKMRAGVTASRARYPERTRARLALQAAVQRGAVVVGPCYAVGPECRGGIEGHHPDYAHPLAVIWTCRAHHRALDRQRKAGAA